MFDLKWIIITQIITLIFQFFISSNEKLKNIFLLTFILNILNLICHLLNKDYATVFVEIFIVIRSFIYIYREKLKKYKHSYVIPWFFIIIKPIVGLLAIKNGLQIISILIPSYTTYYMWYYTTTQKLRIGNIVGNLFWAIYNLLTGLWILSISNIITIIMNVFEYIKNNKIKKGKLI